MKEITQLQCPYCQGQCQIAALRCEPCGARVEANFKLNEFSRLSADDLHFLRIFLQFEGRIRDMSAPLGLSYPTIRTRLSQLKEKILLPETKPSSPLQSVLEGLEAGDLSFEETLAHIKNLKREKK